MKSLAAAILAPALLLATAALAQDVPPESATDLWCGVAFAVVVADAPADVTEEQKVTITQFSEGSARLIEAAKVVHLASGYTEETFKAHVEGLNVSVAEEINSQTAVPAHSFEECAVLIGMTP